MSAWKRDARCRTVGVDPFFPAGQGRALRDDEAAAKAVCAWCRVQQQCLDAALQLEGDAPAAERGGIWGGKNARERHAIHRQQRQHADA